MTGPPPARSPCGASSQSQHSFLHYRQLLAPKAAVGQMTDFSCQNQNQAGAARLPAALLRFVTAGRIKRALKDVGSRPVYMGLIHDHKQVFSWLNEEKRA